MKNKDPKQKMKLLYISYEFGFENEGGVARVIKAITSYVKKQFEVTVVELKYAYDLEKCFCYVYTLNETGYKRERFGNIESTINKLLCSGEYECVHVINTGREPRECTRIIKENFPDIKIIYSVHSIMKHDIIIRNLESDWVSYEEMMFDEVDNIHVLNNTSLNYLIQSYPEIIQRLPITTIPNGIDEKDFGAKDPEFEKHLKNQIMEDDIVVVCLSRWSFGKGLEYLVNAIPLVKEKIKNIKFIIAGRKEYSWENGYEKYVSMIDEKLKCVVDSVIVLGWLNDAKRNSLYSLADICVMPSEREYFPFSILEPMICNVPIVSAKIDCVVELLKAEKECMFYDPTSESELAEKIIQLALSSDMRNEISCNSFQKAKNELSWEVVSKQYIDMYRTIINN